MDAKTTQLRSDSRRHRRGLAWLPPFARLVVVVLATTLPFLAPPGWALSGSTFFTGAVLLILSPRFAATLRRPLLRWILVVPLLTTVMLVLGNSLFSPLCGVDDDGVIFGPLRVNRCGFDLGIRSGLRLGGVSAIGIAWLLSSTLPEFYDGLAPMPLLRRWALPFTRHLQFSLREYAVIAQSLAVRGLRIRSLRKTLSRDPVGTFRRNGIAFLSLLRSLMNRFIRRTSLFAYATNSHVPATGSAATPVPAVEAVSLRIKPAATAPDVLHDASFVVPLCETVLVAGADGAGKSTLLKALAGVIPCVQGCISGTLKLFGTPTKGLLISDFGKLVAYFSQETGVHVLGLTVGQELRLAAASEEAVAEAVDALGLTDLLDRQITMLSGGETIRLVLASVLARRAPLLLMDDPFDQLDRDGRMALIAAMHAVRKESPVTIIVAEKNAIAFRDLITTIIVIEGGTVRTISRNEHRWHDPAWLASLGLSEWSLPNRPPEASRTEESIAELRDVSIELGDRVVLRNVTLELRRGELVLVQGPNGSGKTTAMLGLVGALDANIIAGERWSSPGTRFGYVFQDTALQFATATSLGELLLTRLARSTDGTKQDDDYAREQLLWVGVPEAADPFEIHASHQKLLAFAAMALGADVVVVDEPTIGAGAWAVDRLLTRLLELRAQRKCVVLISHDARLLPIADRVLKFTDGSLIRVEGSATEVRGVNG